MWEIQIRWANVWITLQTGFQTQGDGEWAIGMWKQENRCYNDPFQCIQSEKHDLHRQRNQRVPEIALCRTNKNNHLGDKMLIQSYALDQRMANSMENSIEFLQDSHQWYWSEYLDSDAMRHGPFDTFWLALVDATPNCNA